MKKKQKNPKKILSTTTITEKQTNKKPHILTNNAEGSSGTSLGYFFVPHTCKQTGKEAFPYNAEEMWNQTGPGLCFEQVLHWQTLYRATQSHELDLSVPQALASSSFPFFFPYQNCVFGPELTSGVSSQLLMP